MSENLPIWQIKLKKKFQARLNGLSQETVEEYAEAIKGGSEFPPIDVYHLPDNSYVLVDGWHRLRAHQLTGLTEIKVNVVEGSEEEAHDYAIFKANRKNGQRLTSADRRKIAYDAVREKRFEGMSSRKLGKIIGVSHALVNNFQTELKVTAQRMVQINEGEPQTTIVVDADKNKRAFVDKVSVRTLACLDALYDNVECIKPNQESKLVDKLERLLVALS